MLICPRIFYKSALSLLNQVREVLDRQESEMVGTRDQFLAMKRSHTKSLTLCIHAMILNTLRLFKHDPHDRRRLQDARAKLRYGRLMSQPQIVSRLLLQRCGLTSRSGRMSALLQPLLDLESGNVCSPMLKSMKKSQWNLVSRAGRSIR